MGSQNDELGLGEMGLGYVLELCGGTRLGDSFIVFSQLDGLGARGLFAVCTVFSGASHYTATLWDVSSIHVVCQIAQLPRSCSHSHLRCCDLHAGRGEGICSSVFATTMLPHSDVLNDYVTH